jgi:F1F0 ATPase subunit 2
MTWDIAIGLTMGVCAGALFFAGLAAGLRLAMRTASPGPLLLASAGLRISLLLGVGWGAAQLGTYAALAFAAGFVAVRIAVLAWARWAPLEG